MASPLVDLMAKWKGTGVDVQELLAPLNKLKGGKAEAARTSRVNMFSEFLEGLDDSFEDDEDEWSEYDDESEFDDGVEEACGMAVDALFCAGRQLYDVAEAVPRLAPVRATRDTIEQVATNIASEGKNGVKELQAVPGSGKTSVLPVKMMDAMPDKRVVVVVPNRPVLANIIDKGVNGGEVHWVDTDDDRVVEERNKYAPTPLYMTMSTFMDLHYTGRGGLCSDGVLVLDEAQRSGYAAQVHHVANAYGPTNTVLKMFGHVQGEGQSLPSNVRLAPALGDGVVMQQQRVMIVHSSRTEMLRSKGGPEAVRIDEGYTLEQLAGVFKVLESKRYVVHTTVEAAVGLDLPDLQAVKIPTYYVRGDRTVKLDASLVVQLASRAGRRGDNATAYYAQGLLPEFRRSPAKLYTSEEDDKARSCVQRAMQAASRVRKDGFRRRGRVRRAPVQVQKETTEAEVYQAAKAVAPVEVQQVVLEVGDVPLSPVELAQLPSLAEAKWTGTLYQQSFSTEHGMTHAHMLAKNYNYVVTEMQRELEKGRSARDLLDDQAYLFYLFLRSEALERRIARLPVGSLHYDCAYSERGKKVDVTRLVLGKPKGRPNKNRRSYESSVTAVG